MEHYTRSLAGYGNVSIYSSISNFKSVYAPNKCTYLDQAGGRREIVLPGTFFDRGLSANETLMKSSNRRKKDLYQLNGLATSE
ncbi:hypothetical protein TNCT_425871 [Trichonephila clavata]|uniref:Uncharacterized protein n=1 Tax=Trichonephila clavata TaxID=2740835 RepID=A0A8X6F4E0_TRICU|nr:hypothetical protein TNCT_425871 [Trichonephila clavata]